MSGVLVVFRNRRAKALKLIVNRGQGYWLARKRLSSGRSDWERNTTGRNDAKQRWPTPKASWRKNCNKPGAGKEMDLAQRAKGDAGKVKTAERLRADAHDDGEVDGGTTADGSAGLREPPAPPPTPRPQLNQHFAFVRTPVRVPRTIADGLLGFRRRAFNIHDLQINCGRPPAVVRDLGWGFFLVIQTGLTEV